MVSADLDNVWDEEEWTDRIKIICNDWYIIMEYGYIVNTCRMWWKVGERERLHRGNNIWVSKDGIKWVQGSQKQHNKLKELYSRVFAYCAGCAVAALQGPIPILVVLPGPGCALLFLPLDLWSCFFPESQDCNISSDLFTLDFTPCLFLWKSF